MARRFYLSVVYDINGYDRLDLTSKDSLEELDELTSNFVDRSEVIAAYLNEYNINPKKGRVCIVYEDTELKKKEIELNGSPDSYPIKERSKIYSYVHIIPIMYKDKRLLKIEECLILLKQCMYKKEIIDAIMYDKKSSKGELVRRNKRYLFETEEEQDYICNLSDYRTAISLFLKRIKKSSLEDQYFYCRSLMDICNLSVSKKKKVTNLHISKKKLKEIIQNMELTDSEKLERETDDMDSFYLHHDLDEVIRLSPNSNRPIGSERKKKK